MKAHLSIALALFAAACDPAPSELEPTTEAVHALILKPSCGERGCHATPQPQQGLDFLDVERTLATSVDVVPTVGSAADVYPAIVVPGDPDASFLIAKVLVPGVDQGVVMPPTDQQLTDEAVEVLEEWIRLLPEELE